MALTITIIVMAVLFGGIGFWRGTRRGIVTLAGTLFGAVLVDLWQDRWAEWLRTAWAIEDPAQATFGITAVAFIVVALLIGYGGSTLLPKEAKAARIGLGDRILGSLVGALNAALIISYLLRYAEEAWTDGTATALIAASPVAAILAAWLAWFILALVITTSILALLRMTLAFGRMVRLSNRQQQVPQAKPKPAIPQPGITGAPPATAPRIETDKRVLDTIGQKTGEKK